MREGVKLSAIRPDRNGGRQQARAMQPGSAGREAGGGCWCGEAKGQPDPLSSGPLHPCVGKGVSLKPDLLRCSTCL